MAVAVVLLQEIPVVGCIREAGKQGFKAELTVTYRLLVTHEDYPPHPPPHSFLFKILLSLFACHACYDNFSDVVTKLKIVVFHLQALIDTDPYIVRGDRFGQV